MKATKQRKLILALGVAVFLQLLIIIALLILLHRRGVPAVARPKGKIAIVIDDWGYNLNNLDVLGRIKYPLTASVLPNLTYSEIAAYELNRRGFEVILHLPMQPKERVRLEKNTVSGDTQPEQIRRILLEDLKNFPFAKGVSNHMGSSATESRYVMEVLLKELKKKKLYFLDSFVTGRSVACSMARRLNVPTARRDVFLDNQDNPAYIRQQLARLKDRARAFGSAIGIGHDRKNTLEALASLMPEIEKQGYRFVFVSELVR